MRPKPIFWALLASLLFWYLVICAVTGHSQGLTAIECWNREAETDLTNDKWYNVPDNEIVDAIYLAEGGKRAKVPYGILSVRVANESEARRVCLNTVRNNKARFLKQTKYRDYIEFLGSRYCPVGADNDNGNNKYWVRNVKYYIERGIK